MLRKVIFSCSTNNLSEISQKHLSNLRQKKSWTVEWRMISRQAADNFSSESWTELMCWLEVGAVYAGLRDSGYPRTDADWSIMLIKYVLCTGPFRSNWKSTCHFSQLMGHIKRYYSSVVTPTCGSVEIWKAGCFFNKDWYTSEHYVFQWAFLGCYLFWWMIPKDFCKSRDKLSSKGKL